MLSMKKTAHDLKKLLTIYDIIYDIIICMISYSISYQ